MGAYSFGPFAGEFRGLEPHFLPETAAVVARDAVVGSGGLRPLRGAATVRSLATTGAQVKKVFRYTDAIWIESVNDDVDIVRAPIQNDGHDRLYMTSANYGPTFTTNALISGGNFNNIAFYEMGVRVPSATLTATVGGTADDEEDLPDTRYYVYTYVDAFGAEGPPSPISNQVEVRPGEEVLLQGFGLAGAGNFDYDYIRIYRSATGSAGSIFQYVGQKSYSTADFTDTLPDERLGEALRTSLYDPPPSNLLGLTVVADGFLAGFYDNVLCFSEPGAPHAWPVEYQRPLDSNIVGLAAFRNSLLVATEGQPYRFTGVDPASMSRTKLEIEQPCVNKGSIVSLEGGAAYACPDGLIYVNEAEAYNLTERHKLFDRDAWQALDPSTIEAVQWENRYMASFDDGAEEGIFWVELENPEGHGVIFSEQPYRWFSRNPEDDVVYAISDDEVLAWDEGAALDSMQWRSRPVHLQRPSNLAAARVHAAPFDDGYFKFFGDGAELRFADSVTSNGLIRLPGGKRPYDIQVEVGGTNRVFKVEVATSASDLRSA